MQETPDKPPLSRLTVTADLQKSLFEEADRLAQEIGEHVLHGTITLHTTEIAQIEGLELPLLTSYSRHFVRSVILVERTLDMLARYLSDRGMGIAIQMPAPKRLRKGLYLDVWYQEFVQENPSHARIVIIQIDDAKHDQAMVDYEYGEDDPIGVP